MQYMEFPKRNGGGQPNMWRTDLWLTINEGKQMGRTCNTQKEYKTIKAKPVEDNFVTYQLHKYSTLKYVAKSMFISGNLKSMQDHELPDDIEE